MTKTLERGIVFGAFHGVNEAILGGGGGGWSGKDTEVQTEVKQVNKLAQFGGQMSDNGEK